MAKRALPVAMDDVLDAMTRYGEDPEALLDRETGEVVDLLDPDVVGDLGFDPDDPKFERIPRREAGESVRLRERFAGTVADEDVRARLFDALDGRGAFGRFRKVLHDHADVAAAWHAFEREDLLAEALAWLSGLGIAPLYELRPLPGPPVAAPQPSQPGEGAPNRRAAPTAHEMVVALHVTDDDAYAQYRAAMTPLLERAGGGFRYDFRVAETLRSASDHPINRVFAIFFASRAAKDAFFAHPDYVAIKRRWFAGSVGGVTILGSYDR